MNLVMCPGSPPGPIVRALVPSCHFQHGDPQPDQPAYFPDENEGLFRAGKLRMDASREFRGALLIGSGRSRRRTRAESYGQILDVPGTCFVGPREVPDPLVLAPLTAAGLEEARRRYLALRPFAVENALSDLRHAILNWVSWINFERMSNLPPEVVVPALVNRITPLPSGLHTHLRQFELHLRLAVTPPPVGYLKEIEESAARASSACMNFLAQTASPDALSRSAAVVAALDELRGVVVQRNSARDSP